MGVKSKKGNVYGERVITEVVQVFWASVDKPEGPSKFGKGGDFKIVIGIQKGSNYDTLKKVVLGTAKEAFGNTASFSNFYLPFQDGSKKSDADMSDFVIISAKSTLKPQVIDADGLPFAGPVFRGSKVRVSLVPMAYESPQVQHGKGVTFKLGNVQVVESSAFRGPKAEDEFGIVQSGNNSQLSDNDLPF